jgi:hypothetical protein
MAEPKVSLASDSRQFLAASDKTHHLKISWIWHLLNFSPFFLLVWFVSRFSTNVPIMDEWFQAYLFHAVRYKTVSFNDFFALNNEHRLFFPRLIWTPLAFATHWNLRVEMMLNLVPALIVFAVFYQLALRQAKQTSSNLFNLANFTTSLFLFSFVQYGTWLWGIGGAFLLVQASVSLAIGVCFIEKLHPWTRFGLVAFFCLVASFSSAQGLLSWFALCPCIVFLRAGKPKIWKFCIWGLLFAASLVLYTYHFRFTRDNPLHFLSHPLEAAKFYLALLGAPFCQWGEIFSSIAMASVMGGVILLALLACLALLRGHERKDIIVPWLSVALFGLLFAAMVTAGRSGEGVIATMQSRYITGTIFVSIATIQLGRLACVHKGMQVYLFLVGALTALMIFGSAGSLTAARLLKEDLSHTKLFVELVRYMDPAMDESPEGRFASVFPGPGIRPPAELLNDLGFLHLASGVVFMDHPSPDYGLFESADGSGDLMHLRRHRDQVTVSGWASLPGGRGLPKVVLISYGDEKTFITGAVVGWGGRPDIATLRRDPRYLHSGWRVSFPAKFLPAGEGILKAWVYDPAEKKFLRLPESGGEKQFRVETQ